MSSAPYRSESACGTGCPDGSLDIRDIGAAGYDAGCAFHHGVPNASGMRVGLIVGTKQISTEPTLE
jgi:hypothetical protein